MKQLPPWRTVAKPHSDILHGHFDASVFAANLAHVASGEASPDYTDPKRFFEKTYLTQGLKDLLGVVLNRLAGKPGSDAVTDIITSFGGGKTHTLTALYHLAQEGKKASAWAGVQELLKEIRLKEVPTAKVVILVADQIDVVQGIRKTKEPQRRSLWGELAWQLAGKRGLESILENDKNLTPPSGSLIAALIPTDEPCLILIDELMRYIDKARGVRVHQTSLASLVTEFIADLIEAVKTRPKTALVLTLPASIIEFSKESEDDYKRLKHRVSRTGRVRALTEGDEIYEIVRRRLFADSGDPEIQKQVAQAFYDYYRAHIDGFPPDVATASYLQKLERAYPFHPELLDLLNERWSSIPAFQKTRGVLRMLAILVGALYQSDSSLMIQPCLANLGIRDFRAEVLRQADADSQFQSVIESDIAGTGARALKIDQHGNETYQREHLAEKVATAIFFYSFGGAAGISSATLPQLRLSVLYPGLEPAFIPDTLEHLRKQLYYLEAEAGYRFTVTPNLNAIRVDQEAGIDEPEIHALIQQEVKKQAQGGRIRVNPYPQEPRDVPDQTTLTLVVVDHQKTWEAERRGETERFVREILKGGTTFRTCKNSVIFLMAERSGIMEREARTVLALEAVDRLYGRTGKLNDSKKRDLAKMLEESRKRLPQAIWGAYRWVATAAEGDALDIKDIGQSIHREGRSLADQVWEFLEKKERVAPKIGPGQLLQHLGRIWPKEQEIIPVQKVKDAFFQYPYLPMILDSIVLQASIAEAARQGLLGFGIGDPETKEFNPFAFKRDISPEAIELTGGAYLIRPELAKSILEKTSIEEKGKPEQIQEKPEAITQPRPVTTPKPGEPCKTVRISAKVDWQRWPDFYDAIIKPLVQAGAQIEIKVDTLAKSDRGLPANTVDITLPENISQYKLEAIIEKLTEEFSE